MDTAPEDIGRPNTRWRRIAEELESDIAAGTFTPGALLPTVLSLAERFDVNRHTVRQALQYLQSRGLVSVEQGRGTFVRSRVYDYRLGKRVRFRNSFAGDGADAAASLVSIGQEPLTAKEAAHLALREGTPAWIFRTMRVVDGLPLSSGFHRLEVARFPDLSTRLPAQGLSLTDVLAGYGIVDYVRLSTRIAAAMPTEDEREILKLGADQPVLMTRGVDGLPDGTPFHLTTTAFAADRIELVLETQSESAETSMSEDRT